MERLLASRLFYLLVAALVCVIVTVAAGEYQP
jgi:hypothetical protein